MSTDEVEAESGKELATMLADRDKQIAAVLADERLSEEEQERRVAEIRAEAAAQASKIHVEQMETAQNQVRRQSQRARHWAVGGGPLGLGA